MAGNKSVVTLTLAGDASSLQKAFDQADTAADRMADGVKAAGERTAAAFTQTGGSSTRMRDTIRDSTERTRKEFDETAEHSKKFDDVGERFDQMDTKAMGFRDGVTGVQDSMTSLSSFAKGDFTNGLLFAGSGLSDLGSSAYNTVVPAVKKMVTELGVAKIAIAGLGVAAVAGALTLLYFATKQDDVKGSSEEATFQLDRLADGLELVKKTADSAALSRFLGLAATDVQVLSGRTDLLTKNFGGLTDVVHGQLLDSFKDFDDRLAQAVKGGQDYQQIVYALTAAYGDQTVQTLLASGALDHFKQAGDDAAHKQQELTGATQASTDALSKFADKVRAQTDPMFALTQAQDAQREALENYQEVLKDPDHTADDARAAQDALAQAELGVLDATTKVGNIDLSWYQKLHDQGFLSSEALAAIERNANNAKDALGKLNGTSIGIYINAYSNNPTMLDKALSGYYADYGLHLAGQRAAGGPVMAGRDYLVGEDGPEILHMGAMSGTIIPNGSAGAPGGGVHFHAPVNVYPPTGYDFDRWLKDIQDYERQGIGAVNG